MSKYKIIDGEEVEVEETKPFLAGALLETAKTPVTPYRASHVLLNTADAFVENKDKRKILEAGMGPRREIPEESNDKENTATFANGYTSLIPGFDGIGEEKYNEIFNQPEIKVKKPTARERYETRQFEYNLEDDPLWQQYISSARRNGQNAMTDTMAKVASQTGGIAGSYAVAAGAGAYNDYMQEANEVIPYLEQLAYQKYQDELNRDLNLYDMEEKEKMEKANEDAIAYKWQSKGDITDDEEVFMRSMGYWFDENGSLVGPDGNTYATKGGKINDLEAAYNSGAKLSPEDILDLENSGQGYKYQNGVLYKNG
ncbi:MAG: hypothetical protein U0L88_10700, partial [Acutalibacteraceae bacterium]|nr:hypothetical protein [Acutalibacteraceae bacterium]